MDFSIPPEFWWSTDILLIINPIPRGMDQEIHPCGQGRVDSVKINPTLLRMRECKLQKCSGLGNDLKWHLLTASRQRVGMDPHGQLKLNTYLGNPVSICCSKEQMSPNASSSVPNIGQLLFQRRNTSYIWFLARSLSFALSQTILSKISSFMLKILFYVTRDMLYHATCDTWLSLMFDAVRL